MRKNAIPTDYEARLLERLSHGGPRHGYSLLRQGGMVKGSLYRALLRLLKKGWAIRTQDARQAGQRGRDRWVYEVTAAGRAALARWTAIG